MQLPHKEGLNTRKFPHDGRANSPVHTGRELQARIRCTLQRCWSLAHTLHAFSALFCLQHWNIRPTCCLLMKSAARSSVMDPRLNSMRFFSNSFFFHATRCPSRRRFRRGCLFPQHTLNSLFYSGSTQLTVTFCTRPWRVKRSGFRGSGLWFRLGV